MKPKFIWGIAGVAVMLILLLVVFVIPFPYTATEQYVTPEPYTGTEYYTDQEPTNREVCTTERYDYDWEWADSSVDSTTLNTQIELTNQEDRPGTFEVQFAYYDYAYHPYNEDNKESLASWEEANMYSDTKSFSFTPYERRIVEISTPKKNQDASYWWRGRVTPPTYRDCRQQQTYRDIRKQRTVTKYRDSYQERKITLYASLIKQWTGNVDWYIEAQESETGDSPQP